MTSTLADGLRFLADKDARVDRQGVQQRYRSLLQRFAGELGRDTVGA